MTMSTSINILATFPRSDQPWMCDSKCGPEQGVIPGLGRSTAPPTLSPHYGIV